MKHTLRFAVRHPRYYHTLVCRRLGPGRWEVESFSNDPRDYQRQVMTRQWVRWVANLLRETARLEAAHLAKLAERGRYPTRAELEQEERDAYARRFARQPAAARP